MIYQGRSRRHGTNVARSQLAVRLGLAIYAAICAAVVLRCAVLVLAFPPTVWSVNAIVTASSPIVLPLSAIPAAQRTVAGSATLSDLTTALVLLAAPLPFLSRQRR